MSDLILPDSSLILPKPPLGSPLNLGYWSTDGLVFYWRGIPAGKAIDSSLFGNHGTIVGAEWVGEGLFFNSVGEVNIGTGFNALPTTYNFTLIVWAKASTLDALDHAVLGINGTDDLVLLPYDSNAGGGFRIFWRDLGGSIVVVNHDLAGTGYHQFVFASYASNDHRVYIDGREVATLANTGTVGPFSGDAFIGAFDSGSQNFHGSISNVSIYNRALSPGEIAELYIRPNLPVQKSSIWLFSPVVGGVTETKTCTIGAQIVDRVTKDFSIGAVLQKQGLTKDFSIDARVESIPAADGVLYFSAMDITSGVTWTNPANAVGQYNVATAYTSPLSVVDNWGGGNVDDATGVPLSLDSCKVRFWDYNSNHSIDFIVIQVWDEYDSGWETLETFNSGNQLPSTETEFDYTAPMQQKFDEADDKTAFMNGLQFRWYLSIDNGDDVAIATQGVEIEYSFILPTKAFTLDARVVDRYTKDFSIGAVLQKQGLTKDFSIGAVLQKQGLTKDFSIDAQLVYQLSRVGSIDARIVNRLTKDFSVGAVLQKQGLTKDFSIDARVVERLTKDFSIAAQIIDRLTKDCSIDAQLIVRHTKDFSIDARVVDRFTKTFTIGAHLAYIKTFTLDAVATGRLTKEFTIAAALQYVDIYPIWPLPRPVAYDADKVWDEETETWYSPTSATGAAILRADTGRYQHYFIAIGEDGDVYYGVL